MTVLLPHALTSYSTFHRIGKLRLYCRTVVDRLLTSAAAVAELVVSGKVVEFSHGGELWPIINVYRTVSEYGPYAPGVQNYAPI